ncbi:MULTISPECIES: DUF1292 domain-containing protein [Clostridium]|uniref:DUF1292 domain-containing protein n=1 Tax=Clostridium TaxID=1485 RepID=UPI00052DE622|nr:MULTISPECIES: DUF1292 domain-containing protein [Clostridium]KGK88416.1 hypothetical protein DP68_06000 [Clostridium sp. HMP27]MBE6068323.1 DUF1292 domain-containing protein [Clostridium lundense]MBM7868829.1 uncharacterized protein YrzB (UPF0473 family) [Clostridium pascui]
MENDITNIVLTDENGEEIEFEVITKLDIEDKEYVIVVPKDEDTDEAVALRIDKDEDGNDLLVTVDDEDEFAIVVEAYETLFDDEDLN